METEVVFVAWMVGKGMHVGSISPIKCFLSCALAPVLCPTSSKSSPASLPDQTSTNHWWWEGGWRGAMIVQLTLGYKPNHREGCLLYILYIANMISCDFLPSLLLMSNSMHQPQAPSRVPIIQKQVASLHWVLPITCLRRVTQAGMQFPHDSINVKPHWMLWFFRSGSRWTEVVKRDQRWGLPASLEANMTTNSLPISPPSDHYHRTASMVTPQLHRSQIIFSATILRCGLG